MYQKAELLVEEMGINTPSIHTISKELSGGNQRKLILAREMDGMPDLILAVSPTAGLDMRTSQIFYRKLYRKAEQGCAILLISYDLDEISQLCNRVMVLSKGSSMGILDEDDIVPETIGTLMSGIPSAGEWNCPGDNLKSVSC